MDHVKCFSGTCKRYFSGGYPVASFPGSDGFPVDNVLDITISIFGGGLGRGSGGKRPAMNEG